MKVFGVDLGITSIGWALIDTDKQKIISSGVRIFTQSVNRADKTLASIRREHRSARRTLSRKKQRIKQVKQLVVDYKLLTEKEISNLHNKQRRKDVWQLREDALHRELNIKEWVRILLHIAKRRGYKSNRKSEDKSSDADKDTKRMLKAIEENTKKMTENGYKTIGSMIFNESEKEGKSKRNKKDNYMQSVAREMLQAEIETLYKNQKHLCSLEFMEKYKEIAFTQLPIKWDKKMVGKCQFEKDEPRGPKHCFSVEKSVLLSKINNTELVDKDSGEIKPLFEYGLNTLLNIFLNNKEIKYSTIRRKLKIPGNYEFKQIDYNQNFEHKTKIGTKKDKFYQKEKEIWLSLNESQKRSFEKKCLDKKGKLKNYRYSSIRSILRLDESKKFSGVKYEKNVEDELFYKLEGYHKIREAVPSEIFPVIFSDKDKFNKIAEILSYEKDDKTIRESLKKQVFDKIDIDEEAKSKTIENLLEISFSGFNHLSVKAINKLLPHLESGKKYHEAAKEVYGHHSQFNTGTSQKYLRPLSEEENYQITNPTIKRTFSQFRKVVNAVIAKYGSFDAMHIELARELKNSKKKRIEISLGQKEFRDEKNIARLEFKEQFNDEEPRNGKELLKFILYKDQHAKCIYSYKPLDLKQLRNHGYVEVDHILPRGRTFDNSLNNKALCLIAENQEKKGKTPFEYLANGDKDSEEWQKFTNYVKGNKNIKKAKRNRLLNTTLPKRRGDKLTNEDIEDPDSGVLARNINDTAYSARFIKNFVENNLKFNENDAIKQKVKTRNGALTDQLRYNWGIPEKNRDNNLHHAEDAIILAFATQGEVQRMSRLSSKIDEFKYTQAEDRRIKFTPPFDNFKNAVDESIEDIFVSFAPRRKISGAAHKETVKSKKDNQTNYKFPVNKGVAEQGEIKRVDVFMDDKRYKFVVFYSYHFHKNDMPNKALNGDQLTDNAKFLFSLYKDDLIEFKRKKDEKPILAYFRYIESDGRINYQIHSKSEQENTRLATGPTLEFIKKYHVSVLGDYTEIKHENRIGLIKKSSPKRCK